MGKPGHGPTEKGLRCVHRAGPEGRHRFPAPGPKMCLVIDEERRPELACQLGHIAASDGELSGLVEKCLANNMEQGDIKKAVTTWRADYWRA